MAGDASNSVPPHGGERSSHTRSEVGVDALAMYCDCRLQMVRMAQSRSEVGVQGARAYSRGVQPVHGRTTASAVGVHADSTNCPLSWTAQSSQTRSLLAVALVRMYCPVLQRVSSAHWRSLVAVGASASYSLAEQF